MDRYLEAMARKKKQYTQEQLNLIQTKVLIQIMQKDISKNVDTNTSFIQS